MGQDVQQIAEEIAEVVVARKALAGREKSLKEEFLDKAEVGTVYETNQGNVSILIKHDIIVDEALVEGLKELKSLSKVMEEKISASKLRAVMKVNDKVKALVHFGESKSVTVK